MQEKELGIENLKVLVRFIDFTIMSVGDKLKDGFQWTDVLYFIQELVSDRTFDDLLSSMKEVFPEVKDMDLPEGMEIGVLFLMAIPKYVEAFKKDDVAKLLADA